MREETVRALTNLTELIEETESATNGEEIKQTLYSKPGRFIIERRTMSNISTGESTAPIVLRPHPRFHGFPEHTHDYVEFMYVCSGGITHRIGEETVTVSAGDLLVLGKNTKHSISPSSASDIGINIIVSAELFEVILNAIRHDSSINTKTMEHFLDKETTRFQLFKCSQSVEISNLIENMIYSSLLRKGGNEYLLEQSVRMLACYLCNLSTDTQSEGTSYTEKTKKKITKYIRSSYSTATLTETSRVLGLSAPYLSRWICANFGMSFKELLMRERFSVARDLLRSTDTPIGDIIIHVGYENSSYFHKEFKKRFGTTPGKYRKQYSEVPKSDEKGLHCADADLDSTC